MNADKIREEIEYRTLKIEKSEESVSKKKADDETIKGIYHGRALDYTALGQYHILLEEFQEASEAFGKAAEYYLKRVHNVIENEEELNRQAVRRLPAQIGTGCYRAILSGDSELRNRMASEMLAVDESYRERATHPVYWHLGRLHAGLAIRDGEIATTELEKYLSEGEDQDIHPEPYEGLVARDRQLVQVGIEESCQRHESGLDDQNNLSPRERIAIDPTVLVILAREREIGVDIDCEFIPWKYVDYLLGT